MARFPIHGGRISGRLALAALGLALIVVHFALPPNHEAARFVRGRLASFPTEWRAFRMVRDPEKRMQADYGLNYDGPMFIRKNLEPGDRLQLPPRAYLTPYCPPGQDGWVDPRFIYYVAGPLTTFAWRGEIRPDATHALVVDTLGVVPGLRVVDLRDDRLRERVAALYRRAESRRR